MLLNKRDELIPNTVQRLQLNMVNTGVDIPVSTRFIATKASKLMDF